MQLIKYLTEGDLSSQLRISDVLSFHWSNWDKTCQFNRSSFQNFNNNLQLIIFEKSLQDLKNKEVWLSSKSKSMKTNLYELYLCYLDSRLRMTWFDRKDEILFSFDSEQGPYYKLTSMKWMDRDIYAKFIYRKIIQDQLTLRSFRLNSNIDVVMRFDQEYNEIKNVTIHQISENGIIFKVKGLANAGKFRLGKNVEIKIPISEFVDSRPKDFEMMMKFFNKLDRGERKKEKYQKGISFIMDSKVFNKYGNQNNLQRASSDEFFFFATYEDLRSLERPMSLRAVFVPIIQKIKAKFEEQLNVSFELNQNERGAA